jgi:C4-dicarboxylate-binding protein DctP
MLGIGDALIGPTHNRRHDMKPMTSTVRHPTRRTVIQRTAVLASALIAAPAIVRAQQKFVCRIAHSEAVGSPLTQAFETWTKVLNEKGGGRITAQHFPASQLG